MSSGPADVAALHSTLHHDWATTARQRDQVLALRAPSRRRLRTSTTWQRCGNPAPLIHPRGLVLALPLLLKPPGPRPLYLLQRAGWRMRRHPLDCGQHWGGQDALPAGSVPSNEEIPLPVARLSITLPVARLAPCLATCTFSIAFLMCSFSVTSSPSLFLLTHSIWRPDSALLPAGRSPNPDRCPAVHLYPDSLHFYCHHQATFFNASTPFDCIPAPPSNLAPAIHPS